MICEPCQLKAWRNVKVENAATAVYTGFAVFLFLYRFSITSPVFFLEKAFPVKETILDASARFFQNPCQSEPNIVTENHMVFAVHDALSRPGESLLLENQSQNSLDLW